jgi:hypothetical protein
MIVHCHGAVGLRQSEKTIFDFFSERVCIGPLRNSNHGQRLIARCRVIRQCVDSNKFNKGRATSLLWQVVDMAQIRKPTFLISFAQARKRMAEVNGGIPLRGRA